MAQRPPAQTPPWAGPRAGSLIRQPQAHAKAAQRAVFEPDIAAMPAGGMMDPEHIAEAYWMLHAQPRDAWTFEIDMRPSFERW